MKTLEDILDNKKIFIVLFVAMLFLGVFFRIYDLDTEYISVDEPFSLYMAELPVTQMLKYMSVDSNPPFYFLVLHYWLEFLGSSFFIARLLTVLVSIISVILFYFIIKNLFNKYVGFISFSFLALSPFFISYSKIARSYSFFFLFSLLAYYFFVKAFLQKSNSSIYSVGFVLFSVLALYTHYYYILFGFIIGLSYIVYCLIKKIEILFWKLVKSLIAIGVLFFPWLFFFLNKYQDQLKWDHWSAGIKTEDFLLVIRQLFIEPFFIFPNMEIFFNRLGIVFLVLLFIILVINFLLKDRNDLLKNNQLLFAGLFLVITLIFFTFGNTGIVQRYLIFTLIFYLPVLAILILKVGQDHFKEIPKILFLVILILSMYNIIRISDYRNCPGYSNSWQKIASIIDNSQYNDNVCVFVNDSALPFHLNAFSRKYENIINVFPSDVMPDLPGSNDRIYDQVRWNGYFTHINYMTKDKIYIYLDRQFIDCKYIWSIEVDNFYYAPLRLLPDYFDIYMGLPVEGQEYYYPGLVLKLYKNNNYQNYICYPSQKDPKEKKVQK